MRRSLAEMRRDEHRERGERGGDHEDAHLGSVGNELYVDRRVHVRKPFGLALVAALALADPAGASLHGRTIAIDPGHDGGNAAHPAAIGRLVDAGGFRKACDTVGTETASGYAESAYDLDLALRLARVLRAAGATVVLTRSTDDGVGPCVDERARIGNRARADAAISIHADGGPASGRGFHVLVAPARPRAARLAAAVRDAFRTVLPVSSYAGRDGVDVRSDLAGLNLSTVPKVLVESGNMRNPRDAALLSSPAWRQRAAGVLARGLARFLA